MSSEDHSIIISLTYNLTVQTFSHDNRSFLRDHGFFKLEMPTRKESKLLEYIGIKNLLPHYSHEKKLRKVINKT